ncbi:acyltransferase [bacterium]|nr:acyltransferase [bacterium]
MRSLPKNYNDFLYMINKVGFSPIRGLLTWIFFAKGSSMPFLSSGVKILSRKKIKFGRNVWIGQNCYIDASCKNNIIFDEGVTIRENSTIQCRSGLNNLGEGLLILSNTFIGPCAKIGVGGQINIGKNCQIGAHCTFNAESHTFTDGNFTGGKVKRLGISIGDNVWMGDGVTILDGVSIGDNAAVGAGSVVNKNIPSGEVHAGVPAKNIRS